MKVTMRAGVFLRGECFDPSQDDHRSVAPGDTVSLTDGWAHVLIHEGRAVPAAGDVVPAAPPLTSKSITQQIAVQPVAIDTRDPVSPAKKGRK